ncbi:hypothetical protein [Castellaniella sp.]|uniref:hypothetical protein n=1 Tax=Castellaniella sp. TaxID=1955812 RepID=UPI002B002739|nr:hypothetical protein [Castellaniella sp.]
MALRRHMRYPAAVLVRREAYGLGLALRASVERMVVKPRRAWPLPRRQSAVRCW